MRKKDFTLFVLLFLLIVPLYIYADRPIARYFDTHRDLKPFFEAVTTLGLSQFYLLPSALLYLVYRRRKPEIAHAASFVFLSVAVSGILANIVKVIAARYRPKLFLHDGLYGFDWFAIGHNVASFPSGHSATAFGAFVAFGYLFPKWRYLFYLLAVLIASSRIVLDAHYLSDVIAGAFLGAMTAVVLHRYLFDRKVSHVA